MLSTSHDSRAVSEGMAGYKTYAAEVQTHGFTVIPGALSPAEVGDVRRGIRDYLRAGDAIVIDVRTTHRGHAALGEGWDIMRRAAYYPIRHYAAGLSYGAREAYRHALGLTTRHLVTTVYGRRNAFTTKYMSEGRRVSALDSVGIKTTA